MITLYLMSEKGRSVLEALVSRGLQGAVNAVVGSRDANVKEDFYEDIQALAGHAGLPFFDRKQAAEATASPYAIAISWRWLIAEREGQRLIVLHDSLLPRYRGFAPLVNALLNREPVVGVTALYASAEYDRGAIIGQKVCKVEYPITIAKAITQVSGLYEELVCEVVEKLKAGKEPEGHEQEEKKATYSLWRDDEDYRLDFTESAQRLRLAVDALGHPYKGAAVLVNGQPARLLSAEERPDVEVEIRQPGKVIWMEDGCPVVVCGQGLLRITELVSEEGQSLLPLKQFRSRFS